MLFPSSAPQSPAAWLVNAAGRTYQSQPVRHWLRLALDDVSYRFRIHPLETAATLVDADIRFGFDVGDPRRYTDNATPGTTNMTTAVQRCIDIFGHCHVSGTCAVTGITLASGCRITGDGTENSELFLLAASNAHVLSGTAVTDVVIDGLTVNGNQANQSTGSANNWRCIYLLGATRRIRVNNVHVTGAVDHGLFFSDDGTVANEPGKDSLVTNVRVTNCGSATHASGGGAGGTGIAGGCNSTIFVGCFATGNHLNGFKSWGRHIGCDAYSNTGGGFETGFVTATKRKQVKYESCRALSNGGDGFRNQSEVDEITWVACESRENDHCGIFFLNAVSRATISGCWLVNNGQDNAAGARSDSICYDGVAITATSTAASNIIISGTQFFDDQGTPTQQYHIYIRDEMGHMVVNDDCIFGASALQTLFFEPVAATDSPIEFRNAEGLPFVTKDFSTATLTGTTAATTLKTLTIPANSLGRSTSLKVRGRGTVSGTAGTKIVRVDVGGTTGVMSSQAAGETFVWAFEMRIHRSSTSLLTVAYTGYEVGGTVVTDSFSVSHSVTADLVITVQGQLGDATDTITQNLFSVGATEG